MALYYTLLHLWIGPLGDGELALRLPSVFTAVAAVGAIYAFGTRLFGPRVGLISALLLTLNAYQVAYAQNARSYSLLVFLVILSSLAFVQVIERPSRAHAMLYVATSVAAVYAHFFAALVLAAQWFSLAFLERRSAVLKAIAASAAVMCILVIPLVLVATGTGGQIDWIPKPTARAVLNLFYALAGSGPTHAKPLFVAYFIACTAASIVAIKQFRAAPFALAAWRYCLLLTWFVVPIALALAVSVFKPIFEPFYLIICLPPLVLLGAIGISRIPVKWGTAVALLAIVVMASYEDARQSSVNLWGEDWRGATAYVASQSRPGDALIIYPPYLQQPIDYYGSKLWPNQDMPPIVFPQHWSWAGTANEEHTSDQPTDVELRNLLSHYSRVWLFSSWELQVPSHLLAVLGNNYVPESTHGFDAVRVTLYVLTR